jgi:hypothetical protein
MMPRTRDIGDGLVRAKLRLLMVEARSLFCCECFFAREMLAFMVWFGHARHASGSR